MQILPLQFQLLQHIFLLKLLDYIHKIQFKLQESLTLPERTLPLNPTRRLPRSSLYDQLSIPCPISEYSAAVSAGCTLLFRSPRLVVAAVWRQSTCLGLLCISDQLQRWPNSARCNFKFNIYANPL